MFVKLSILSFYHRIFTARRRIFKYALVIVGTYVILVGVGSTVEFIVQCLPIPYFWVGRTYLATGKTPPSLSLLDGWCMPQVLHLAVPLLAGLVSDITVLILPAIGLWNLQLAREKKFGVYFALSLGIFACGIEIVRIYYCYQTNNKEGADITWTNSGSIIWTGVELSVAVVCACIPASAPLLQRIRNAENDRNQSPYGGSRKGQLWPRSRLYTISHNDRARNDNDSLKGLKEGSASNTAAQNPDSAIDDPYSCVIAYDSTLGSNKNPESGIPLQGIQVSKHLDISHAPSGNHETV